MSIESLLEKEKQLQKKALEDLDEFCRLRSKIEDHCDGFELLNSMLLSGLLSQLRSYIKHEVRQQLCAGLYDK